MRARRAPPPNRRRRFHAVAALAALLLGACAGPPSGADRPGKTNKPSLTISEQERGGDKETDSAALAPEPKASRPSAVDADPKRLIGLDHGGVVALLGNPEFRRKDAPAELWRYRAEGCTLNLFLYGPEKAAEADKRVLVRYVEARATGDAAVTTTDCLRALLQARAAKQTS